MAHLADGYRDREPGRRLEPLLFLPTGLTKVYDGITLTDVGSVSFSVTTLLRGLDRTRCAESWFAPARREQRICAIQLRQPRIFHDQTCSRA